MKKQDQDIRAKKSTRRRTKAINASSLTRSSRGKVLTKSDGIYSFIGIGASKVPGGISTKKHQYCK